MGASIENRARGKENEDDFTLSELLKIRRIESLNGIEGIFAEEMGSIG